MDSNADMAAGQLPTFKVVIVGDSGVGKTCLLKRYSEGTYTDLEEATLGAQFSAIKLTAEFGTGGKALQYGADDKEDMTRLSEASMG